MTKKTLEELQETHSEMLATASDLGLQVPEELKSNYTDAVAGDTVNKNLDALIREHRKKPVAPDESKGQSTVVETKPAKKKRAAAPEKSSKTKQDPIPDPAEQQGSTTAMSKSARKKLNGNSRKTAKSTKSGAKRMAFEDGAKITWLGKDNPARDGSGKHDRIDGVRKHSGKTVGSFRGKHGTLGWCVKNGLAKVHA